jgi:hypothetical protein
MLAPAAPVVIVLAAIAAACEFARPLPPPSVEPVAVPSDVLFYPHVIYGADDAYLVDGKWYRPGVSGWVVFSHEPVELELLRRCLEPPPAAWFSLDDR